MAQESRCIALSPRETLLSLDAHRRALPGFLPSGEILALRVKSESDVSIVVKMVYGKSVHELEIDFKLNDLTPVLLQFCSENNLKIPAAAKKTIKFENDALSLTIFSEI